MCFQDNPFVYITVPLAEVKGTWTEPRSESQPFDYQRHPVAEKRSATIIWRRVRVTREGVQFDIDLPNKKVFIESEHSVDLLLETLKKTGKNAIYVGVK
ncbi:UNVERIFIED_CONTAM: hypothetical protein FKN15_063048 [Acipenser sinensis]